MDLYTITSTPNPNSLKFTAPNAILPSGMVVARSPQEAASHPLAASLFALPGVCDVLILGDFLTISKTPDSSWDDLLPPIQHILDEHLAGDSAVQ